MEEKNSKFNIKELETVLVKATSKMKVGDREYEEGETVLSFKSVAEAYVSEGSTRIEARGGQGNYPQVLWETPNGITMVFNNGLMTEESLNMILRVGAETETEPLILSANETISGGARRKLKGNIVKAFVYLKENEWNKTNKFTIEEDCLVLDEDIAFETILVDYTYEFAQSRKHYKMGVERFSELFRIEAKGIIKNSEGEEKNVYLIIPKARLQSDLNIALGDRLSPSVETFRVIGLPVTENGKKIVSNLYFLEEKL